MLKLFDGLKHLNTIYLKSELKPFQFAEFIFLILVAFFVPISWRIASYVMIGLFVSTILKGVFEEGFKNNPLQYNNRIIYIIFIAFWVLYAVSFVYSENSAEARVQIGKKLPFLLFSLFFLCSNLSYLTKDRVKTIMYGFVCGILTLLLINLVWAGYDIIFNDNDITRLTMPYRFFKTNETIFTYVHRAYFSIFTCFGFVFCFVELFSDNNIRTKVFDLVSSIIFILVPFYLMSRSGVLCTILLLFVFLFWITFIRKEKKIGIISCIIILSSLIIGCIAFPKSIERFQNTIKNVKTGKGDCRLTLRSASRSILVDNFLFGVGAGDRSSETLNAFHKYKNEMVSRMLPPNDVDVEYYISHRQKLLDSIHARYENSYNDIVYRYIDSISKIDKCDYSSVKHNLVEYQIVKHCIKYELNAHNQYIETRITVGVLGLVLLLALFLFPIYMWIRNKNFDIMLFSLILIFMLNCLFESIFERQMGIMFFVFFYLLLFHADFCQQTTDNGQ